MKLHFLGTGAADWRLQDRVEGKEFRRWCSTLVDDSLLIDPGPHIFDYIEKTNQPHLLDNVTDIIVTHSHGDHFNSKVTQTLCSNGRNCRVYGDAASLRKLKRELGEDMKIDFRVVTPFQTFFAGEYEILPLISNHYTEDVLENTLNYAIKHDGKKLFYGLDTGWIPIKSYRAIRKYGFDCMVMELTMGDEVPGDDRVFSHTSLPMLEIMLQTLRCQGAAKPDCRVIADHLARTLHGTHEETVRKCAPLGVEVAYDGFVCEF